MLMRTGDSVQEATLPS